MKNYEKFILPISLILVALILGGSFYYIQKEKQKSIERQQKLKIELEKEKIKIQKNKEEKNYILKRKKECLEIYKIESKKWNNVNGYKYNLEKDKCLLEYINPDWKEGNSLEQKYFWKSFLDNNEENKKLKYFVESLKKGIEEDKKLIEENKEEYIKRNTFNGELIENVAYNSYYSGNDYSFNNYKQEKNKNGVILINDKEEKIYLGNNCDALSKKFGKGNWEWGNGGFIIYFKNKKFGFPRQELNIDNNGKCMIK